MQNKVGKTNYDAKVAEFDRLASIERRQNEEDDWRNTQKSDRQEALDEKARLKKIADDKANRPWYSKLGDEALNLIPEAAGLIPVKFLQGPAKALLKEGVNQMRGSGDIRPATEWNLKVKAHMKKNKKTLHESSQALANKKTRKPSAWNLKVKNYMSENPGISLKDALQDLKK